MNLLKLKLIQTIKKFPEVLNDQDIILIHLYHKLQKNKLQMNLLIWELVE